MTPHVTPASAGTGPLSTAAHTAQVAAAFADADDADGARLAEVLQAAVRHLHAFVEEVGLTREEWTDGIRFLTEVGARCDEVRQEFVLLSDVLGVSMLLEMVNSPPAPGVSEPTVLGPFYVPGAPACANGGSIVFDAATGGQPLVMAGTVRDTSGKPVSGASLEVWEVQPNGRYDIEEDPAKRNLRATLTSGPKGEYRFATVRPVDYTIPHDGPVGELLRASGRHPWRPAHIHFRITAGGYQPLVTHLFDRSSPWLDRDAVFGVRSSLVTVMDGPECTFDFVLEPAED